MSSRVHNASYFPEWMVIRLSAKYDWIFKEETPKPADKEDRARDLGIFFHEWIHHLHNVSTASGVFAYCTTIGLWTSFRWTVVNGCDSQGSDADIPPTHRINIERSCGYFDAVRNKRACNDALNDTTVKGFAFHSESGDIFAKSVGSLPSYNGGIATPEVFHVIDCNAKKARANWQSYEDVHVEIGTVEILEGVASMLERRLVQAIQAETRLEAMEFAPYELLSRFVRHFVTDIDDSLIIACGIAALQYPDPPTGLLMIVRAAAKAPASNRFSLVEELAAEIVERSAENLRAHLENLDSFFPLDEPMAKAVKWINNSIRQRLSERMTAPFFEFDIVKKIAENPGLILNELKGRSCALIFLEASDKDGARRSADMRELRPDEHEADEQQLLDDRLRMWSAFHFLHHHRREGGIKSSESVANGAGVACPLLSVCDKPPRLAGDPNCKTAPWRVGSQTDEGRELCWYHDGAYVSRRGPIVENSPAQ